MLREAKAGGRFDPRQVGQLQTGILAAKDSQLSVKNLADPQRDE